MSKTFQFELVSPEHKVSSEPMAYVSIPGTEGAFGVLPGHASLIATLKAGVVELTPANSSNSDATQKIFVAGGVADVSADNVTILAEEAVALGALDPNTLAEKLKYLEEDLAITEDPVDQKRLQKNIIVTKAKLDAIAA